ncbi:sensor histidine kinase [Streptomyces sp. NPDC021098]|uniref:sensor histidine kinase n=1 Tax=unclassified Streptomyces TaxID=2593676 RepID=UPI0037979DE1
MSGGPARGPRGRLSLRGRLLTICLLLLVVALLGSNALVITLLQRDLVHQLDDRLRTAARHVGEVGEARAPQVRDTVEQQLTGDVYLAYLGPDGHVRRVVRPSVHSAPALPPLDAAAIRERDRRPFEVPAADGGEEWRVIAVRLDAPDGRMGGMPERAHVDAAMSRIEREAARLVRLVEDLLLLARLDEPTAAADLPLHLSPMDLRTLATDALHDLHALDPRRPVTLTGPGRGPPGGAPVLGDEARLRQVTSNLVGNAVAHTPPGTPVRIGVGVGVGVQDGLAVLELHDEGPGMSREQAARVFDRFYRADDARGRTETGGAR